MSRRQVPYACSPLYLSMSNSKYILFYSLYLLSPFMVISLTTYSYYSVPSNSFNFLSHGFLCE